MRLMPILPAERDPRLITMRRGGTLTDEHHRLLAEWAALCAEHVLHFSTRSSRATPDRATPSMSVARGSATRYAWVTHDELLSRRMPPHADYPTRRSSPLSRPGKPRRWHTWQPTIWVLRRTRLGPSPPLHPPVRLRRHASGNESGSEKDSPRRFESWSSMTSEVEARSAGTYSTTDIGPSSPPTLIATDHSGAPASRSLVARDATRQRVDTFG